MLTISSKSLVCFVQIFLSTFWNFKCISKYMYLIDESWFMINIWPLVRNNMLLVLRCQRWNTHDQLSKLMRRAYKIYLFLYQFNKGLIWIKVLQWFTSQMDFSSNLRTYSNILAKIITSQTPNGQCFYCKKKWAMLLL